LISFDTDVPAQSPVLNRIALPFLLLATAFQLWCAFQPIPFLNDHVLRMDDAYYYFQVARNVADLGRVTFDGVHVTSGVQMLWTMLLSALATLVHERVAFVRAILVLSTVLNLGSGLQLRRLGRNLSSSDLGNIAVILWSAFMLAVSPTMLGVEYPLHILIIVVTISVWWTIHADPLRATSGRLQLLGLLLTLNFWIRLDSGLLSVLVALSVLVSLRRAGVATPTLVRQAALFAVWPIVGALGYIAIYWWAAGTLMPVSGLVKSVYAGRHFAGHPWFLALAGHLAWWLRVVARPSVDVVSGVVLANHRPLFGPVPVVMLATLAAASAWTIRAVLRERLQHQQQYRVMVFLALLWAFGTLHAALVVATLGHFSHVTQHYYGWLYITWCLWVALMIERRLAVRGSAAQRSRAVAVAAVSLIVVVNVAFAAVRWRQAVDTDNLHNRRLAVIAWIDEHVPADARIGAWNAGQLGYFLKQPVVNLDGLANDSAYLKRIESGVPLADYLRQERIEYLVDNDALDMTMPYRASWDHDRFFHRTEPWSQLEKLYVEPGQTDPIIVLRVR
jgi:hypothetical protein